MRTTRKESTSGYYHVMIRGINKLPIFATKVEKEKIIQYIIEVKEEVKVAIVAYCIMNNHLHLLVKAEKENLVQMMKKVGIRYAMYYNKKYERIGSVFQDRFKSQNVENEGYLLCAIRYIHNNPVKAKIVKEVTDYKYSSINEYYSGEEEIIDSKEKLMIKNRFNSLKEFLDYHKNEDMLTYLDIKEDMKKNQIEIGQKIIEEIMIKKGIIDIKNVKEINKVKKEVINQLIIKTDLTAKEISELTDMPRSTVAKIKTKFRNTKAKDR